MRSPEIGFAKTSPKVFPVLKGWTYALTNAVKLSIQQVRSIYKKEGTTRIHGLIAEMSKFQLKSILPPKTKRTNSGSSRHQTQYRNIVRSTGCNPGLSLTS